MIPQTDTRTPTPARTVINRPADERQHLATLLRRARYLAARLREIPTHVAVRRELKALCWALGTLGDAWGLAMTDDLRAVLNQTAPAARGQEDVTHG
jgi:hypothetical protein